MNAITEKLASVRDAALSFRRADQEYTRLTKLAADAKDTRNRAYSIYEAEQESVKELLDPLHYGPLADPTYKETL